MPLRLSRPRFFSYSGNLCTPPAAGSFYISLLPSVYGKEGVITKREVWRYEERKIFMSHMWVTPWLATTAPCPLPMLPLQLRILTARGTPPLYRSYLQARSIRLVSWNVLFGTAVHHPPPRRQDSPGNHESFRQWITKGFGYRLRIHENRRLGHRPPGDLRSHRDFNRSIDHHVKAEMGKSNIGYHGSSLVYRESDCVFAALYASLDFGKENVFQQHLQMLPGKDFGKNFYWLRDELVVLKPPHGSWMV